MNKSEAYQEGYNHYWHGGQGCPYESGTIEYADWWTGWEAAVKEDRPPEASEDTDEDDIRTTDAKGIDVFWGLVRGYYQATRKAGHRPLFSLYNAISLTKKAY